MLNEESYAKCSAQWTCALKILAIILFFPFFFLVPDPIFMMSFSPVLPVCFPWTYYVSSSFSHSSSSLGSSWPAYLQLGKSKDLGSSVSAYKFLKIVIPFLNWNNIQICEMFLSWILDFFSHLGVVLTVIPRVSPVKSTHSLRTFNHDANLRISLCCLLPYLLI